MTKRKIKLGGLTENDLIQLKDSNFKITCTTCKEEKNINHFSYQRNKNGKIYLYYKCNNCCYKIKLQKYGNKISDYTAKQRFKEINTISGRALLLRNRCKQRSKRYGYEFNLSKELIISKLRFGICEATGVSLDFGELEFNPYSPSIDRIDSNKGYTDDNIQVVCMIYNLCKNKFTTEQVSDFFKKLKL